MRNFGVLGLGLCLVLSWAQNTSAQEPGKEKKDAAPELFKLILLKIGTTYQGLKYKPATGEAWQIVVDKWEKVTEPAPCPAGQYQILLIPTETTFLAIRIERLTGSTSLFSNRKWVLIKEPGVALANPPKKAVRDGKGFELRHVRVGDQLHFVRFHTGTGAAARIAGNSYVELPEAAGAIPAGNYDVTLMATKDTWMAFRFDQSTGGTWLLRANQWDKVIEPE